MKDLQVACQTRERLPVPSSRENFPFFHGELQTSRLRETLDASSNKLSKAGFHIDEARNSLHAFLPSLLASSNTSRGAAISAAASSHCLFFKLDIIKNILCEFRREGENGQIIEPDFSD